MNEKIAYHEAGHAYVAYFFGWPSGHIPDAAPREQRIVYYLAGWECEVIRFWNDSSMPLLDIGEAMQLCGLNRDIFIAGRIRAREILTSNWDQVVSLALENMEYHDAS